MKSNDPSDFSLTAKTLGALCVAFLISILFTGCAGFTVSASYEQDGKSVTLSHDGKKMHAAFGIKR